MLKSTKLNRLYQRHAFRATVLLEESLKIAEISRCIALSIYFLNKLFICRTFNLNKRQER